MCSEREYHSKGGRKAGTGGITMLGESPCDNCEESKNCRNNGLACCDYLYYMKKGKVRLRDRVPSADCYMRIQASGSQKENSQKVRKEEGRSKESAYQKESRQEKGSSQKAHRKKTCILGKIKASGILQILTRQSNLHHRGEELT